MGLFTLSRTLLHIEPCLKIEYEKSVGCDRISYVLGEIAQRWQRFLAGGMIAPIDKLVDNNVY